MIKDVVENSRIDFEEGGVEASALELLQSVSPHLLSHTLKSTCTTETTATSDTMRNDDNELERTIISR